MRAIRAASFGVAAWLIAGTAGAGLMVLLLGMWSDAFAVSGLLLVLGSLGWALGPFKTPMVWSEGALTGYQPNANAAPTTASRGRWRVVAVPAFALAAGVMLLAVGAAVAAA